MVASAQTSTMINGVGTKNRLPKFTSANKIGNSQIIDNGKVGVNTLTPSATLHVNGTGKFSDSLEITTMGIGDSSTQAASTAFVKRNLSGLGNSSTTNLQNVTDAGNTTGNNIVLQKNYEDINLFVGNESNKYLGLEMAMQNQEPLLNYYNQNVANGSKISIGVLQESTSPSRRINFPDKNGTVAMVNDINDSINKFSWKTTGNAGTTSSNFFGTTDNEPIYFKMGNAYWGKFDYLQSNINLGFLSGVNSTGQSNTFLNANAGRNSTGAWNNFIGDNAGRSSSGTQKNAFGYFAGYASINSSYCNYFGASSGERNNGADYSNFFGFGTGLSYTGNNVGANNIIIGKYITLPNAASNSMNIGGVLFGTNFSSSLSGNPSFLPVLNGRIGIGQNNPQATLDINGNIKIVDGTQGAGKVLTSNANGLATWQQPSTGWSLNGNTGTTDFVNYIGTNDAVPFSLKANNVPLIKLGVTNNLSFNQSTLSTGFGSSSFGDGTVASGNYSTSMGENTVANSDHMTAVGMFNEINTPECLFAIGNGLDNLSTSNAMTVFKNGKIGIGTISPNATLDIVGTIKITDGTQGANKVLTCGANGSASWQNSSTSVLSSTNATDANYTAVVNTFKYLPTATLSTNRTITIPAGTSGDILEIYNNESVFNWLLAGSAVYFSDGVSIVPSLASNTNYLIRYVAGKWRILN